MIGGESGIRTHGTLSRTHAFQACALNRSAISPAGTLPSQNRPLPQLPRPRIHPGRRDPGSGVDLQGRPEGALRNFDLAELPHPLLALLLLLQKLALAADVAAIALRRHILGQSPDRLARDDPAANRR